METRTLYAHQQQALSWAKPRTEVALFMEMRLGKCAVTIRWLQQHKTKRVLVVGVLSGLPDWESELMIEGVRQITDLAGMSDKKRIERANPSNVGWFLINYEALRNSGICRFPWDAIVVDESTKIKNPKAKVTKTLIRRYPHVPHRAILSGLPAPEDITDVFSQFHFLNGEFLGFTDYWSFQQRLFRPHPMGYGWIPKPGTRQKILTEVRKRAFILTRKSAGVGPIKVYERRVVPMNPVQRQASRQITKEFRYEQLYTKYATTKTIWLQRVAGGFSPDRENPELLSDAKTRELIRLLDEELKGQQLVVWFRFNEELAYVYHTLKKRGESVGALLGSTSYEKRRLRIRRFQKKQIRVFCIQVACGLFSLNLATADTAVYYSNSYELEDRLQSEDRIVLASKRTPVLYIDLVTEKSADEAVVTALRDKRRDAQLFRSRVVDELRALYA